MKKCCFFGHTRFAYEDCRDTIKSIVIDLIEYHGVTAFIRVDAATLTVCAPGSLERYAKTIPALKISNSFPTYRQDTDRQRGRSLPCSLLYRNSVSAGGKGYPQVRYFKGK